MGKRNNSFTHSFNFCTRRRNEVSFTLWLINSWGKSSYCLLNWGEGGKGPKASLNSLETKKISLFLLQIKPWFSTCPSNGLVTIPTTPAQPRSITNILFFVLLWRSLLHKTIFCLYENNLCWSMWHLLYEHFAQVRMYAVNDIKTTKVCMQNSATHTLKN